MAAPLVAALRQRTDLKESVLHTAQELAHRASVYGIVRASNAYMGHKCHCHQRTFQRHVMRLIEARILKKTVVKRVVKIRVGDRLEERLRNEINTYVFTIAWQKPIGTKAPIDTIATTLPLQEREKEMSIQEELARQRKGIRYLTPGTDLWQKVQEEIARLEGLLRS